MLYCEILIYNLPGKYRKELTTRTSATP